MCDDSCAIIPPLSVEYYEAKIQMLLVFSWKPALEMPRYVEIQIYLFLKVRSKKYSYWNCGGKFEKFN